MGENNLEQVSREQAVLAEVTAKIRFLYSLPLDKKLEANDRIIEVAAALRKKYPDAEACRLFHAMIQSTVQGECSRFDFPGEDSIAQQVDHLYQEYHQSE